MSILRGRFSGAAGADMLSFASSLELDLGLFDEDIDGSIAHARMLGRCEIIDAAAVRADDVMMVPSPLRDPIVQTSILHEYPADDTDLRE